MNTDRKPMSDEEFAKALKRYKVQLKQKSKRCPCCGK